ncbi:MAG: NAD(P)H-hydrate epimerase [Candidatus Omnitrophica bacterium]|nr:NAD(P)H-hydrate epimerase [Candidatus Omnitrophota bacterium]
MRQKTLTVKQIQTLDDVAICQYGVPSIALMENAGKAVADEIIRQLKRKSHPKVVVICGLGNNAGDGFVTARHLLNAGIKINVYLIGSAKKLKQDAAINYQILTRLKHPVFVLDKRSPALVRKLKEADIVVDAIFGVGLNREIKGVFKDVIETVNGYAKKVIAVDIPSGMDGTTGNIYGVCIKAKTTVTFSFAKKGFLKKEGPKHVGKIKVVDIGIPIQIIQEMTKS